MQRTAWSLATAIAVVVATGCSSSEPPPAPTEQRDGTEPVGGGGPCAIANNQEACDACVNAAVPKCNEVVCREEDIALENCSVMAVYYPCRDKLGNESLDCCKLQQTALIQCWNTKCSEMQACS